MRAEISVCIYRLNYLFYRLVSCSLGFWLGSGLELEIEKLRQFPGIPNIYPQSATHCQFRPMNTTLSFMNCYNKSVPTTFVTISSKPKANELSCPVISGWPDLVACLIPVLTFTAASTQMKIREQLQRNETWLTLRYYPYFIGQ